MTESYQGLIAQIKNEGYKEGYKEACKEGYLEGQRNIILRLLNNHTLEEVTTFLNMETTEILEKINNK